MFDKDINNHLEQDQIFRSILEKGTEPAPAHIWDKVEEDLNRIAQRRRVVLWFRRTAIGAAAAAALAFGLFMDRNHETDIVSPVAGEGMIAVTSSQDTPEDITNEVTHDPELLAMATKADKDRHIDVTERKDLPEDSIVPSGLTQAETSEQTEPSAQHGTSAQTEPSAQTEQSKGKSGKQTRNEDSDRHERFTDFWPEEKPSHKRGASLTVSGITGTNSAQNSSRVNPMRRPGITEAPKKTGIKETSTNTTYGIPVSAGIGVKVNFAPRWSIGVGVNYTLLTRRFYGNYTYVDNGNILKDISSDIRGSQHYIGIPVNFYYDIVNRDQINFYAYAGGTAEKCIADKYQVINTEITHTEKVKGMQLSADIGIGVEFLIGKHLGIYIDPSLRYYFDNNQPKSIRTAQPLMFGFEMGFRARL